MATEKIDAERVEQIRGMLSRPGGEAEVRKRFGEAALGSDEYAAAKREISRVRRRQAEARLDAVAEEHAQTSQRQRDRRQEVNREQRTERVRAHQGKDAETAATRTDAEKQDLVSQQRRQEVAGIGADPRKTQTAGPAQARVLAAREKVRSVNQANAARQAQTKDAAQTM